MRLCSILVANGTRPRSSSFEPRRYQSAMECSGRESVAECYIPRPMPASRSRYAVIFFTVLIDLIGFGIVMPILPFSARGFGATGLAYGTVLAVYSFMQFVATALLGKLSDRIGRRPVLLTTMLFNAAGYALFAFAGSYWVL